MPYQKLRLGKSYEFMSLVEINLILKAEETFFVKLKQFYLLSTNLAVSKTLLFTIHIEGTSQYISERDGFKK